MARYYIDTSIWMDYYEDRKDPSKDLGQLAFNLLRRLLARQSSIIISTFLLKELGSFYSDEIISGIFKPFEEIIEYTDIDENEINLAKELGTELRIPFGDVLHAILAKKNKAILVTRDKHFNKLSNMCTVLKPEDIKLDY